MQPASGTRHTVKLAPRARSAPHPHPHPRVEHAHLANRPGAQLPRRPGPRPRPRRLSVLLQRLQPGAQRHAGGGAPAAAAPGCAHLRDRAQVGGARQPVGSMRQRAGLCGRLPPGGGVWVCGCVGVGGCGWGRLRGGGPGSLCPRLAHARLGCRASTSGSRPCFCAGLLSRVLHAQKAHWPGSACPAACPAACPLRAARHLSTRLCPVLECRCLWRLRCGTWRSTTATPGRCLAAGSCLWAGGPCGVRRGRRHERLFSAGAF